MGVPGGVSSADFTPIILYGSVSRHGPPTSSPPPRGREQKSRTKSEQEHLKNTSKTPQKHTANTRKAPPKHNESITQAERHHKKSTTKAERQQHQSRTAPQGKYHTSGTAPHGKHHTSGTAPQEKHHYNKRKAPSHHKESSDATIQIYYIFISRLSKKQKKIGVLPPIF